MSRNQYPLFLPKGSPPSPAISRTRMLYCSKAVFPLLCLVLTADALRSFGMENSMRQIGRMLYGKRDSPLVKREIPAQLVTVRPRLSNDPRDLWRLIPPSSSP